MDDRIAAVRDLLASRDLDAVILSGRSDVRWASGFSGSSGLLVVSAERPVLVTDGRYTSQAKLEVSGCDVVIAEGSPFDALAEHSLVSSFGRIGYQADLLTVQRFEELRGGLVAATWIPLTGFLNERRAVKSDTEVTSMKAAQEITEAVFAELPDWLRPGVSERDLSAQITFAHLRRGAERMSFDPIVAFGSNSALPHARPSHRTLSPGDAILVDFGCVVDGYASDMTRTLVLGAPPEGFVEAYRAVQRAQAAAIGAACSRMSVSELDAVARDILYESDLGDAFSHSLGHGIGLDTHEWPRVGKTSLDVLPGECVVTIEPGVYFEGRFGIRIEDMILVRDGGATNLTSVSRDLIRL